MEPQTPEDAIALTMGSPYVHFSGFSSIEGKSGQLIKNPRANEFQTKACAAYEWCTVNGVAPRLIFGPKPRQSYGSTIACAIAYHHSRRYKVGGLVMADEGDRTKLLWRMLERCAQHDEFGTYWGTQWTQNAREAVQTWQETEIEITGEDGRKVTRKAYWVHETANDEAAGSAGTRHILWFSEAGLYEKDPRSARQDAKVIGNAINSVPPGANTLIIMESVAGGPEGYFYETHQGAVTLEERMAGKVGNGWIKVESAWHECADYQLPRNANTEAWFNDDDERFLRLKPREVLGRELYGWNAEQIAWRRMKIIQDLKGDEATFDREFPESAERAFAASSGAALDAEGMTALIAMSCNVEPEHGVFQDNNGRRSLTFLPTAIEHEQFHIWEHPVERAKYLIGCDTKSDKIDASGKQDCNSAVVVRDAFMDVHGAYHPVKVVARVAPENREDAKLFAHRVALLARYYGDCAINVEANAGGGVIRELLVLGCNVLKRPQLNKATTKASTDYGWWTSDVTRRLLDSELQAYVREQTIEILCKHLVSEMVTLVIDKQGKMVGSGKRHDDDPLALMLALVCLRSATPYIAQRVLKAKAPDARRWKSVPSWT